MNLDQFLRLQQVMNEVAVNMPERGQYAALSAAHHTYNVEIVDSGFCKMESPGAGQGVRGLREICVATSPATEGSVTLEIIQQTLVR